MKEYSEISLAENVDNQTFSKLSNQIKSEFNGKVEKGVSDLQSKYRNFIIEGS